MVDVVCGTVHALNSVGAVSDVIAAETFGVALMGAGLRVGIDSENVARFQRVGPSWKGGVVQAKRRRPYRNKHDKEGLGATRRYE